MRRLVILGATGDLTFRYLLPALAELEAGARLPDGLEVVGIPRPDLDDVASCDDAVMRLGEHAPDDAAARHSRRARYGAGSVEGRAASPDADGGVQPIELDHSLPDADLSAYAHLLLAVFDGEPMLSVRDDEAEETWRIVAPVLAAWAQDLVPLEECAAGSDGPPGVR